MQKINVIVRVHQGIVEDPQTFISEESAGKHFESIVISDRVKFRKKYDDETWEEYATAFEEYEDSDKLPYDKIDHEIHWYETDLLP